MQKKNSVEELPWKSIQPQLKVEVLSLINLILLTIQAYGVNRLRIMKIPKSELNEGGIMNFDRALVIAERLGKYGELFKIVNNKYTMSFTIAKNTEDAFLAKDIGENFKQNEIIEELEMQGISVEELSNTILMRITHADVVDKLIKIKGEIEQELVIKDNSLFNKMNEDEPKWPVNYVWTDENTYDLGGKGKITFMSKEDNKIRVYFKMMVSAKSWVGVSIMSHETGETSPKVRIRLNQITDKINAQGAKDLLELQSRGKRSESGAYRLVPFTSKSSKT